MSHATLSKNRLQGGILQSSAEKVCTDIDRHRWSESRTLDSCIFIQCKTTCTHNIRLKPRLSSWCRSSELWRKRMGFIHALMIQLSCADWLMYFNYLYVIISDSDKKKLFSLSGCTNSLISLICRINIILSDIPELLTVCGWAHESRPSGWGVQLIWGRGALLPRPPRAGRGPLWCM